MLFVDLAEQVNSPGNDPGMMVAANAMRGFVERLSGAELFVLDPMATEMGVGVFLSRPSSMLAALPYVKLPSPLVWMEFSNMAARAALARFGNDNKWAEGGVHIDRTGFLISETPGGLEMECAARFRVDGRTFCELMTARCVFDTESGEGVTPERGVVAPKLGEDTTGKMRRYYDMIATDPKEYAAKNEIEHRFDGTLHPVFADLATGFSRAGVERLADTYQGHLGDALRYFTLQILPALILMNCRNAMATEEVPAPAKLNKARRKKGRTEIGPYRLVKMHLSAKRRSRYEASGASRGVIDGSTVIGHFKVRKSGVYWWSEHSRLGGPSETSPRAVRVVTR